MDYPSSLDRLLLIVFGGGGLIAGVIALLRFVANRYDIVKRRRSQLEELDTNLAIENRRIDIDLTARNHSELLEILETYKQRVEELKGEIKELSESNSLSRQRIAQIYAAARKLRRAIDTLDIKITQDADQELIAQVEIIKKELDELEHELP